jgi:hypothetical protein
MAVSNPGRAQAESGERYDFDRLEACVDFLIGEHERLSSEREALLAELVEREHRIAALEAQVEAERNRRATAVEGVDKIIGRLDQLRSSVAAAVEAGS